MFRRLGWIAASYFTRPLTLAFTAAGVLFSLLSWLFLFADMPTVYETTYPQPPAPELLVDSQAGLDAVRRDGLEAQVDAINLNFLWADMHRPKSEPDLPVERAVEILPPGEAFFQILEEFPNLRSVTMTLYDSTTGASQLAQLRHLEYLALDGLAPTDFDFLRHCEALRWLELTFFRPLPNTQALGRLPRLETMVIRSRYEVSDQFLAGLADLPHLRRLVLNFFTTAAAAPPPPLTAEGFAALDHSKSLETLYIGNYSAVEQLQLLTLANSAVSHLRVEPARVARNRPDVFPLFPTIFFALAIGMALAMQFRNPLCRLAPHFVTEHALVAGAFFTVAVSVGAARVVAGGCWPPAALVVILASSAVVLYMGTANPTPEPGPSRRQMLENLLAMVLFFATLAPLFLPALGREILLGARPWTLVGLALVGLAALALAVRRLHGLVTLPASLSTLATQGTRRGMLLRSQSTAGWPQRTTGHEHLIETWSNHAPRWTWWRRVRRWQIGNAPFGLVRAVLIVFLTFGLFLFLFRSAWGLDPLPKRGYWDISGGLPMIVTVTLFMVVGRVALAWRARLLALSVESLRPYTRRGLQNEMAAAFLFDLTPPVLMVALLAAVGINLQGGWQIDWARVPFDLAVFSLSGLAAAAGIGSLVVVVKRDWVVLALLLAIGLATALAIGVLTAVQLTPHELMHRLPPHMLKSQLFLVAVVGGVLAAVMWRRFLTVELGNRA